MPPQPKPFSGLRFSRLLVIKEDVPLFTSGGKPRRRVLCKCDCGKLKSVDTSRLKRGSAKSCGCSTTRRSLSVTDPKGLPTHGRSKTPEYRSWQGMIYRCFNPRKSGFSNYGGRGITVCQRWLESFCNFLEDVGPRPSPAHSMDRIDTNGNYSPENCRWATSRVQNNNQRKTLMVEVDGTKMALSLACEKLGLSRQNCARRIRKGECWHGGAIKGKIHE